MMREDVDVTKKRCLFEGNEGPNRGAAAVRSMWLITGRGDASGEEGWRVLR